MVKSRTTYVPARGDTVWISLDPQVGHEQAGRRPALVLSPSSYNGKIGLAVICPITNKAKGYPFEVELPPGLAVTGVVLTDQVKSLDWQERNADFICTIPDEFVDEVVGLIESLLEGRV